MTTALGRVLTLALLSHGVIAGPLPNPVAGAARDWDAHADTRSAPDPAPTPRLHGRFLHITGELVAWTPDSEPRVPSLGGGETVWGKKREKKGGKGRRKAKRKQTAPLTLSPPRHPSR